MTSSLHNSYCLCPTELRADHLLGVSRGELQAWPANCVQNVGGFTPGTETSAKVQVNLVTGKPGRNAHF